MLWILDFVHDLGPLDVDDDLIIVRFLACLTQVNFCDLVQRSAMYQYYATELRF